jgi:serpin B
MTAAGARSETEKEMIQVLYMKDNIRAFHQRYAEHMNKVENKTKVQLKIASSLWFQKGFKFQGPFLEILNKAYKANLNQCDFAANPNKEASRINQWVEERTEGRIKDLVNTGMISNSTKMMLINAIYFYGDWMFPFNKELTLEGIFYQNEDQTLKVKFMNSMNKMKYAADDDFQLLAIPYQKNEASMLVFLPKSRSNFDYYVQSLHHDKFKSLLRKMTEYKINLSLPKFNFSSQFELGEVLSEIGMKSAFTNYADFSGINGKRELKIDQVIHKAFIKVSEKGTEAAAATIVNIKEIAAVPDKQKIIRFNANHPFICMILDNASGQILFCGVINHPS